MREVVGEGDLEGIFRQSGRLFALFYASWCPFCRCFLPIFEEHARKNNSDGYLLVKLDDDMNPLWTKYDVEVVPTVILFEHEKLIRRLDGKLGVGLSEEQLKGFLESTS